MKRRRFYDYVDAKHLAFVEKNQQSVFLVLSEIAGFGFEDYLKYLFAASVSMSWTACEVAAFEIGNFIAREKLKISEDSGSMSFRAKRINSITDFNLKTVIKL